MTKRVDQSTLIIKQQQATIKQLQAKLSGKSFVSHEHYAALQLERDQLAARVGELTGAISKLLENYKDNDRQGLGPGPLFQASKALNQTPAASLARHDAEVLRRTTEKMLSECVGFGAAEWLNKEADRIEAGK